MKFPAQPRVRGIHVLKCALTFSLLLVALSTGGQAQSIDIGSPSPVRTNDVVGRIAARDLGDSRLTDHFYALNGTPGDLLITVESSNLNGDIDVFTAGSLRPLLKFTVYAENSLSITKSIYLRKREDLILRVEARSPNDDEGTYHLRFSGSFEPMMGEPLTAETETPTTEPATRSTDKNVRRVSSVGARIEEPAPAREEVTAAPTPEPAAAEPTTPTAEGKPAETEKPTKAAATNTRARRPASRRSSPRKPPADTGETATAKAEDSKAEGAEGSKPAAAAKRSSKRGSASSTAVKQPAEPEPESGPRLIIQTTDGTFIDRYMSSVRRVMVENGQVVVVGRDGKVERILLTDIVRMSIGP